MGTEKHRIEYSPGSLTCTPDTGCEFRHKLDNASTLTLQSDHNQSAAGGWNTMADSKEELTQQVEKHDGITTIRGSGTTRRPGARGGDEGRFAGWIAHDGGLTFFESVC